MTKQDINKMKWTACDDCHGIGKKKRRLRKKVRLQFQRELEQFEKSNQLGKIPTRPSAPLETCVKCGGSGIIPSANFPILNSDYPTVAIIGCGIGGVALAVACLHRGIPFTLYERDENFEARSQGYGLTLQQASKAIAGLGLTSLEQGIVSTRHVVHSADGKIVGEWGMRKWIQSNENTTPKRTNVHIARQALRLAILDQLDGQSSIKWGHQLIDLNEKEGEKTQLKFQVKGETKFKTANLVVGADGIRSTLRKLLIGEELTPLRYLDCIVILGICALEAIKNTESDLLDSATVFQSSNGNERIYAMPYSKDSIMWQLSFPVSEKEAIRLSSKGAEALKREALNRLKWHSPIPEIIAATLECDISGYPVYDRELLQPELLAKKGNFTLIGDAAHPMSPFKGQGANQALLDAMALARAISKGCKPLSNWREIGIRKIVLTEFEAEMLKRSSVKVKDSAAAAEFLHTEVAIHESNEPRGKSIKRKK